MKTIDKKWRGRGLSILLLLCLIIGTAFCLPSGVINLRIQELIFPLIAISIFLSGMIFIYQNKPVGMFGMVITAMIVLEFIPDSYKFLVMMTFYLLLYFVIIERWDDINKARVLIFNMVCILALACVSFQILQTFGVEYILKMKNPYHVTGLFANRNETSVFLAMTLPFFFRRHWMWLIPLMLAGFYLSRTMNGIIAGSVVTAGFIFFKAGRIRHFKAISLASVLILLCILVSYTKFVHRAEWRERLQVYQAVIPLISNKPLLGWGLGQSQHIVPLYLGLEAKDEGFIRYAFSKTLYQSDLVRLAQNKKISFRQNGLWTALHNEYLQFTIDAGFIGLGLVLVVIGSHIIVFLKTKDKDVIVFLSMMAAVLSANAFFTFQIGRFTFLTVIFMALIQGRHVHEKNYIGRVSI